MKTNNNKIQMKNGVRRVRLPRLQGMLQIIFCRLFIIFFFSFGQVAANAAKITDKCSNYDRPLDRGP